MKATITRTALAEAVQAVRGLAAKDALSPFSKIRLDVSGCLSLTGSDGNVQVEWRMDGGWIATQGTAVVPGAAFAAFIGAMPNGDVEMDLANSRLGVKSNGVNFKLKAGDAVDFPVMAGPDVESGVALHVDATVMREMLRKTRFAASTDAGHRNLNGVNIEFKDGMLGMTAADGRQLAHVEFNLAEHSSAIKSGFKVTLPTKAVATLCGLLDRMDGGDVDILIDNEAVRVVGDRWAMISKVLADAYPNWQRAVPEKPQHKAELKREAFLEAMGRAALASDESSGVKITLKNTSAVFEAKNDITAASASMVACKMDEGVKGEFRVNPRLMKDALEAIDEDDFTLHFDEGDGKPIKLTCTVPWVVVIMPYRKEG